MSKHLHLLIFLSGCIFIKGENERLTFERKSYLGNEFRIDGFYYSLDSTKEGNVQVYFFYRNGVLFDRGGFQFTDLVKIGETTNDPMFIEDCKNVKWMWGLFQVNNDTLTFEKLVPMGNYVAAIYSGVIENDTTFTLLKYQHSEESKKSLHETYRFREFNPKPDSTNNITGSGD